MRWTTRGLSLADGSGGTAMTGLSPAGASAHLLTLRDAGLLSTTRHGHEVRYHRTDLGSALLNITNKAHAAHNSGSRPPAQWAVNTLREQRLTHWPLACQGHLVAGVAAGRRAGTGCLERLRLRLPDGRRFLVRGDLAGQAWP